MTSVVSALRFLIQIQLNKIVLQTLPSSILGRHSCWKTLIRRMLTKIFGQQNPYTGDASTSVHKKCRLHYSLGTRENAAIRRLP
jgi:hypothetical protein